MACFELEGVSPNLPEEGRYWIAETAVVIGKVQLGIDTSVWFSAVVRGDNEWIAIGENTNIQDNAVLHTDPGLPLTVGANCTIGHRAILHSCTVGDGSLIGMGATVLNDARIGRHCLVGANALVPEGRIVPDNSLVVGMPAKAVRELTEEEIRGLEKSARNYVTNWKRYARDLRTLR